MISNFFCFFIDFKYNNKQTIIFFKARQTEPDEKITIEASKSFSDVTKNSVLVRWVGGKIEEKFTVHWSFEHFNRIVNM